MDEFKVILIMNETTIEVLKEKKQDYTLNLKINGSYLNYVAK